MNGIHDMGGMHGMGPVRPDSSERPFPEPWEGRVWGLLRAMAPFNTGRRRNFRYEHEILPPVEYLRMRYYERFFTLLVDRLLDSGLITAAELERGQPDPGSPTATPRLTPEIVEQQAARRGSYRRDDVSIRPRFRAGQRVRARNLHPIGHTRLPRYTRGRQGTILRDHGIFDLQDTDSEGYSPGDKPQHVYTVRFAARELWGPEASARDAVYVDLWEDYLERA